MRKKLSVLFFFFISFVFLILPIFSEPINIPEYLQKDASINFWFDAYELIISKTNFIEQSNYLSSIQGYCSVQGNAELELVDSTLTMYKYKLTPHEYGYLNITCYATATNENNQIFNATINKSILVIDDPNEICNVNDLTFQLPSYSLNYLSDIIPAAYKVLQTNQSSQLGFPIEVGIDYSALIGQLKNPSISCQVKGDYNISVLVSQTSLEDNSFTSTLTLYLNSVPKNYSPNFEIECDFNAYCDFFGNSKFSKNLNRSFSIVVNVKPLNDSTFYLISSQALVKLNKTLLSLYNLTKKYAFRAALQSLETYESPFWSGIPGLIIDFLLNPFLVLLHQLFTLIAVNPPASGCLATCCNGGAGPLTKGITSSLLFCNPITGSGIRCLGSNIFILFGSLTCASCPHSSGVCGTAADLSGYDINFYIGIYGTVGWLPMLFTTLFSERTFGLTLLTTCDPAKKWLYEISGNGILFAFLNMLKYPPILDINEAVNSVNNFVPTKQQIANVLKMSDDYLKGQEIKINNFNQILNNKVNNLYYSSFVSYNIPTYNIPQPTEISQKLSQLHGYLNNPIVKLKEILLSPLNAVVKSILGKTLQEIFKKNICGGISQLEDRPPTRGMEMLSDYFSIARGVSQGSFSNMEVTIWGKLIAIILEMVAYNVKSKEQCIVFNTLYPLSFLNKTKTAVGIRAKLTKNFDIKIERGVGAVKSRTYYVCPQQVEGALTSYLSVLTRNERCLLSALNWFYIKDIDPKFNGNLAQLINSNLSGFLSAYSRTSDIEVIYTPLLMEYNSIKNLAYCSNIRKYLNCIFEESVKNCQENKLKVNFLYIAKFAGSIYAEALGELITKLIYQQVVEMFPGFCGLSDIFQIIQQVVSVVMSFYEAQKSFKDAEKCAQEVVNKINSVTQNLNISNIDKLPTEYNCNVKNSKNNLFMTALSLIGTALSPNAFDNWITGMLNDYIDRIIDKMIKIGAKRCNAPSDTEDFNIVSMDLIIDTQIDANKILTKYLNKIISTNLFTIKVNYTQKELVANISSSSCEYPQNKEVAQYCLLARHVYPYTDQNYCIYRIDPQNKIFKIDIYGNYDKCRIYLVEEEENMGTTQIFSSLIKEVSCQGVTSTTLTKIDFDNAYNSLKETNHTSSWFIRVVPVVNNQELIDESVSSIVSPVLWREESYLVELC